MQGENKTLSQHRVLAEELKACQFDAVIILFSNFSNAITTWLSRIPYRLAPATKWVQIFYNNRLLQRRSRSEQPEYEYNIDLVKKFLEDHDVVPAPNVKPPYLSFAVEQVNEKKQQFLKDHGIDPGRKLIFVHPGSGGSANNLSLKQYADLINTISINDKLHFVITAGPGESGIASELQSMISVSVTIFESSKGLTDFILHQSFCDCFISGSTGTLHTAGALNCRTIAFYPRKRSSTPLRWQTCNDEMKRMSFTPSNTAGEVDMSSINMIEVAQAVSKFLK